MKKILILLTIFLIPVSLSARIGVGFPGRDYDVQGNFQVHGTSYLNGNVGIGTDSPDTKLHVYQIGTPTVRPATFDNSNSEKSIGNTSGSINLVNSDPTNNNWARLDFGDGSTATVTTIATHITNHSLNYGSLDFFTRGSGGYNKKMIIEENGNVGIGTTSPNSALHILNATGPQLIITDTDKADSLTVEVDGSGNSILTSSGGTTTFNDNIIALADNSNGVKVHCDSPTYRWSDSGGSINENWQARVTAGDFLFQINNDAFSAASTKMALLQNGNVGIGTTSPIATLDVDGSQGENTHHVRAATYTITVTDRCVDVYHTKIAAVTLTLPAASASFSADSVGMRFCVSDIGCNAGSNNITINRAGADTIATTSTGNTSTSVAGDGDMIWLRAISDSEWKVE